MRILNPILIAEVARASCHGVLRHQVGAELTYKTSDSKMVVAMHKWFDAQLSDHGKDAMEGHAHHEYIKMQ